MMKNFILFLFISIEKGSVEISHSKLFDASINPSRSPISLFPKTAFKGQFKSLKASNDFGREISPQYEILILLYFR